MKKVKKCTRCKKAKRMTRHQRICTECKQDGFFNSSYFQWLWDMAKRSDKQAMPDSTEELVEVLEVRKYAIKAKGYFRDKGVIGSKYNYHVGHRYPASKGGKLVADNLVVMPAVVNWGIGDDHGKGLEQYSIDSKQGQWSLPEFKSAFERYDIEALRAYVSSNPTDNDFETKGIEITEVLEREETRLGKAEATGYLVGSYDSMLSRFAGLAGGLEKLERVRGFADMEAELVTYWSKQNEIMGFDMLENDLEVDELIGDMESNAAMDKLKQLKQQGKLGTDEAKALADCLTPFDLEQNAMYFETQQHC